MLRLNLHFPGFPAAISRSARPLLKAFSCTMVILLVLLTGSAYAADADAPTALPASLLPRVPRLVPSTPRRPGHLHLSEHARLS